jgi:hypothetical protein
MPVSTQNTVSGNFNETSTIERTKLLGVSYKKFMIYNGTRVISAKTKTTPGMPASSPARSPSGLNSLSGSLMRLTIRPLLLATMTSL